MIRALLRIEKMAACRGFSSLETTDNTQTRQHSLSIVGIFGDSHLFIEKPLSNKTSVVCGNVLAAVVYFVAFVLLLLL